MDEKGKILQIKEHPDFVEKTVQKSTQQHVSNKVTNPIAKQFIKYCKSSKDKFTIKDILR